MRTSRITALAVAGALGVGGLGVVAVAPALAAAVPGAAAAQDAEEPGAGRQGWLGDRLARITEALSGLVADGTITQEQADAVAETLGGSDALRGPGGHGGGHLLGQSLDAAASALGLTVAEVRDALRDGSTLADLAQEQGVGSQEVVDALVGQAEAALADAVAAGRVTQERADELAEGLPERVADLVEKGLPQRGGGHGPGTGPGHGAGHGDGHGPGFSGTT